MTPEEILAYIKGVRLSFDGALNLEKYGFKVKELEKSAPFWLAELIETPEDARLLGIALAWNGIYHMEIRKDVCQFLLDEWRTRRDKPSLVLTDLSIESMTDIRNLIKESSDWSYILQQTSSKKIHPVTYCYIMELTSAYKTWKTTRWKFAKNRFEILRKTVDIPSGYVIQLSRHLTKTFLENHNERNQVEISSEESGQPGV